MERDSQRRNALLRYAELMIEKINEVESSEWKKPWFTNSFSGNAQNINGRTYNNFNQILLSLVCEKRGYKTPVFVTFKKAQELGANVKKGEKGFPVNYYTPLVKDKEGNKIPYDDYLKLSDMDKEAYTVSHHTTFYHVFNIEQTSFPEKNPEAWEQMKERFTIEIHAQGNSYLNPYLDKMIKEQEWECPINLIHQDKASYNWKEDAITLPTFEQFSDKKEFYYTALHEMAYSTGHHSRLNRKFGQFGDESYAREELVAELSSAFAGKQIGMNPLPRKENAQYLKSWLEQINKNPEFLYKTLKDVSRTVGMIENKVAAISNNQVVSGENTPEITRLYRDNDGIINASIKYNDNIKEVIIYPRGNDYCYTIGSIADKNMQTYFLNENEVNKVNDLLQNNTLSKVIKSNRKTLTLDGNTASIEYAGKKYDATDIIKTLKQNDINVNQIATSEWERLLKGQGLQLNKSKKAIFSITKTPSGYNMKVMNIAKSCTKVAGIEAEP